MMLNVLANKEATSVAHWFLSMDCYCVTAYNKLQVSDIVVLCL